MARIAIGVYVILIFVFALYGNWWGDYAFKGLAYNFGRALFWPAILIPGLGKALGVLVLLGFVGFLTLGRR